MNTIESKKKTLNRVRRKIRTRSKIRGTSQKPRISVFSSLKCLRVQFINDEIGKTVLSGSDAKLKGTKTEKAAMLGEEMSKKALELGIESALFDKGDKKYHGRIKSFAEALRKGGVKL